MGMSDWDGSGKKMLINQKNNCKSSLIWVKRISRWINLKSEAKTSEGSEALAADTIFGWKINVTNIRFEIVIKCKSFAVFSLGFRFLNVLEIHPNAVESLFYENQKFSTFCLFDSWKFGKNLNFPTWTKVTQISDAHLKTSSKIAVSQRR